MAACEIYPVESYPRTRLQRVQNMSVQGIKRRLCQGVAADEVGIVAEERDAGRHFNCPRSPSLRDSQFGLEGPAIVAEIEQLAVVVLSKGRGNLQTGPDNKILPVAREILQRQGWSTDQIDRDTESWIPEAGRLALPRFAVDGTPGGER